MTTLRAIEAFLFVLISAFLTQITLLEDPIDLADPSSQAAIVTALLSAIGIAVRQYTVTRPPGGSTDG